MDVISLPPALTERLDPIGIGLDLLLEERIESLIRPVAFRELLPSPKVDVEAATRAWLQFMSSDIPDDEEWDRAVLLLLTTFTHLFDRKQRWSAAMQRGLSHCQSRNGRPMSLGGSWFEARRRLAARLFHYGRRGTQTPEKSAALSRCVHDYDFLLSADAAANVPSIRARYVGMRGTASLFLGRTAENQLELYDRAAADLEASGPLGDRSAPRSEYLIEAHLHRYTLTRDVHALDAADAAMEEASRLGNSTRALSTLAGTIGNARSALAVEAGDRAAAGRFADLATSHFERALRQQEHQSYAVLYIRLNYAIALIRQATATDDAAKAGKSLDVAIEELRSVEREAGAMYPNLWLPSALSQRAELRIQQGAYDTALADAQEAFERTESNDTEGAPEIHRRAELTIRILDLHLATGRDDAAGAAAAFDWWSENWRPEIWLPVWPLVGTVRWLIHTSSDHGYVRSRRLVAMIRAFASQETQTASTRRFGLSHAGSVMLTIAKAEDDLTAYRDAFALYIDALDVDEETAAPELYGHAGEIALKLAKAETAAGRDGTAIALLQDATDFMHAAFDRHMLGTSFSEKTPVVAVYSRAGEAFARLHAYTGDDSHASEAIRHLESARSLGNSTPALLGLLGDVHFRHGRAHQDLASLRLAVSLKAEARASADTTDVGAWRENLSVTARAAMIIWSITGDAADLVTAVRAAADAVKEAPNWAWPLLQLSEIAALPEDDRAAARALTVDSSEPSDLVRLALGGAIQELVARACRVAVDNRIGFDRDARFAGRQNVYTIADPHRLLNATLIVKETPRENAEREIATITGFRNYLAATAAPNWMKLPEPMSLVHSGAHTAYVMRRAPGSDLGAVALRRVAAGRPIDDLLTRTARFLARYHAWRGIEAFSKAHNDLPGVIRKGLPSYARYCDLDEEQRRATVAALRELSHARVPLVAKKDAHGENWLVTAQNEIVMLDLEAQETTRLPLLYELVQLIEDHGLIDTSASGWEARMRLAQVYLDELGVDLPEIASLYGAFALIRVFVLTPGTGRRAIRRRSESSVVRARIHRTDHYRNLAAFIANLMAGTIVGRTAALLTSQLADRD